MKQRFLPGIERSERKRIWIHAVSVGEVCSLKSLIERLSGESDKEIVLSVTTPAGFEFARREYRQVNMKVIGSPVDFSFTIRRFLEKINPEILILNELELWPNWIILARKQHIPILLINGRISERAFKRYRMIRFLLKGFFNRIDRFLVQAELYRERFLRLRIPGRKIIVCGNIKAETAFGTAAHLPPARDIMKHLKINKNEKKILTLASTHSSDERLVVPFLRKLCRRFSVIMVPRHLNRVEEIEKILKDYGVKYARWSRSDKIDIKEEVLLFDSMGYLFNIFKISDIVFMGGTFDEKIGGHNLYEPAILGKLIVGGPFYNSFPDIGQELEERGVYRKITDPGKLVEILFASDGIDFGNIGIQAVEAVSRRKGSIECILKEMHTLMK